MACFGQCCKATATNSPPSEPPLPNQNAAQNAAAMKELLEELIPLANVIKRFTFSELRAATNNFHPDNSLGKGGFGEVFKGKLENDELIAVKRLGPESVQGTEEFVKEVRTLAKLSHPNLIELKGFCEKHGAIVYELMPLGSLSHHLYDVQRPINWATRLKILNDITRGLLYLHVNADPPVIHRDLKPGNILLDEDYKAKLSDFGMAREAPTGDDSQVQTKVRGSCGYLAPEYATSGLLTMEADIFSFGAVLLELITGRKALENTREDGKKSLVEWVYYSLKKDCTYYEQLVQPDFQGEFPLDEWNEVFDLALSCVKKNCHERPKIANIANFRLFQSK